MDFSSKQVSDVRDICHILKYTALPAAIQKELSMYVFAFAENNNQHSVREGFRLDSMPVRALLWNELHWILFVIDECLINFVHS